MSDIKNFTTLATNMSSVRSEGKENITPREMATLTRLLKEMPESDRSAAVKSVQGVNPGLYAELKNGW